MKKAILLLVSGILALTLFTGCGPQETVTPAPGTTTTMSEPSPPTEMGIMLAYVPASFLLDYDIWFGNPALAQLMYGVEDINNLEDFLALTEEDRKAAAGAYSSLLAPGFLNNYMKVTPLLGWDAFTIDHAIYHETPPPWKFSVNEGHFDTELVTEKLLETGYTETVYGDYSYFWKNDDFEISFGDPIGQQVMASLNRIAFVEDSIITAPATDIMTGILDAISGTVTSLADTPSCAALAQELDGVFYAALVPFSRITKLSPSQEIPSTYDIPGAENWEPLQQWDTAALGYKYDGTDSYIIVSVYYANLADAEADAGNLASRMKSYVFMTANENTAPESMAASYDVGEPVVTAYGKGGTVTITWQRLPDAGRWASSFSLLVEARDLLFLVPDPSPFLLK